MEKYGEEVWLGIRMGKYGGKYDGEVWWGSMVGKYGGEEWWASMVGKYGEEVRWEVWLYLLERLVSAHVGRASVYRMAHTMGSFLPCFHI